MMTRAHLLFFQGFNTGVLLYNLTRFEVQDYFSGIPFIEEKSRIRQRNFYYNSRSHNSPRLDSSAPIQLEAKYYETFALLMF